MTDEERQRLIAEFEGAHEHCYEYARDLNATMRAARRLPKGWDLAVRTNGDAWIQDSEGDTVKILTEPNQPVRAAYLVLSDYLAGEKKNDS